MKNVETLSAQLSRVEENKTFQTVDVFVGTARYMKPNLASLEMQKKDKPDQFEKFVCSGQMLYQYVPAQKEIRAHQLPAPKPGQVSEDNFLSFLFGMLLGDFVGGGAVIYAGKTILQTSYSREVESAADAYGVATMIKMGSDARALGTILLRIAGTTHPGPRILLDHPETQERVAAINAMAAGSAPSRALLEPAEWAALKRICQ